MKAYLAVLRIADYRKLWIGSLISLLGDGTSWTALAWLALGAGGTGALAVIGVCYTLPVMIGGAVVGPMLDRFSRRTLLVTDNVVRGLTVAAVPVVAIVGDVPVGLLYVVAAVYGLFKIIPLGVVPAVVPDLVPKDQLQPAAALETVGYGVAGLIGPAIGGLLIPVIGGEGVLAVDAVTYGLFAVMVLAMSSRLPAPVAEGEPISGGWRPAIRLLTRDRVLVAIVASFMLFNFVFGMLTVTNPWLVKFELGDHPQLLGLLLGVLSGAELIGSFAGGALKPAPRVMLRMGVLQTLAGLGLAFLFVRSLPTVLLGLLVVGVLSGPVTVSSMALRMARIPAQLRGRTMTLMRTVMNASPPLGAAVAGVFLAAGNYPGAIWVMVLAASLPGVVVALTFRSTSFADELGITPKTEPATA
ncbi:MFS transporter [Labedaea rhizosphaerae]|uniref:Putative MFS family arabinose efflux permease n=1 Tax=Labedaea rhizosphaerae TaxID=598644 RepID=A0A4V6PVM0_LABRH|nr:MFS transporter [Labedaea rhizosphaerae]TDP90538.1 putative MFS family arabinose efflux permease [Labedaea rhizosphaerae]